MGLKKKFTIKEVYDNCLLGDDFEVRYHYTTWYEVTETRHVYAVSEETFPTQHGTREMSYAINVWQDRLRADHKVYVRGKSPEARTLIRKAGQKRTS